MSSIEYIKVSTGDGPFQNWAIGSWVLDVGHPSNAQVIVPVEVPYQLNDAEIGRLVRGLVDQAKLLNAEERAERIEQIGFYSGLKSHCLEDYEIIKQYAGKSETIDGLIQRIEERQQETDDQGKKNLNASIKRNQLASNSAQVFRALGERDGFICQVCAAGKNLTIDHVIPLIKGGGNEPENLQLLCKSCNSRKGAR